MEEKTPRKTTTRSRTKTDSASPRKAAPRKRATTTRRTTAPSEATSITRSTTRKAPTRTTVAKKTGQPIMAYVSVAGFLLVLGASAMVGMSDSGQINVSNTISTRIQDNPLNDAGEAITAPNPNQSSEPMVDSGLIMADPSVPASAPVEEVVPDEVEATEGEVLGEEAESTETGTENTEEAGDETSEPAEDEITASEVTETTNPPTETVN